MNSVIYSQMVQENKKGRSENEKANEVKMSTYWVTALPGFLVLFLQLFSKSEITSK